jgi:hypothetical protein
MSSNINETEGFRDLQHLARRPPAAKAPPTFQRYPAMLRHP